jgi:hypothetical protein
MILSRAAAVLLQSVLAASLAHATPAVEIPDGPSSFQYADEPVGRPMTVWTSIKRLSRARGSSACP